MQTRKTSVMHPDTETVKRFFDGPFYLERGRHIIRIRAMVVQEFLGDVHGMRMLDFGCGDGSLSIPFLEKVNALTLVDLSPRMLELAEARIPDHLRAKAELVNAPLEGFEPGAAYDIIICVGVLAHVPSIDATLAKVASCLKPGGMAVLEFAPNPNPLGGILSPYYALRRVFSGVKPAYSTNKMPLAQLLLAAEKHGLHLQKLRRHSFPLPGMGRWSKELLYKYALCTLNNPLLSKIGVEHLMLFKKTG